MADYNEVQTLLARIEELERRISTQETAPRLSASGVGEGGIVVHDGGGITVEDGGNVIMMDGSQLRIMYPASLGGNLMARIGTVSGGYGFDLYRADGVSIFSSKSNSSGTAHQNIMFDNQGTAIAGNSMSTPRGMTWPQMSFGAGSRWTNNWPSTTNSSFDTMAEGYMDVNHDSVWATFAHYADPGTAGEARITIWNNALGDVQIGPTAGVANAYTFDSRTGTLPAGLAIHDWCYVRLQMRRTVGAGAVWGNLFGISAFPSV